MILLITGSTGAQNNNHQDWANLSAFRMENEQLGQPAKGEKRIVLMGNSITIGWSNIHPGFINEQKLINRGIGGQTTPQMVLRFRQDVIDLKPAAVFILAGINDIAGNTGPSSLEMIEDNIRNMAVLARAAGIKVFLCSVLPSNHIDWRDGMNPSGQVTELNKWIKKFATHNGDAYVDYYSAMTDDQGGLPASLSNDGVHPTLEGYKVMEKVILPYIRKVRK